MAASRIRIGSIEFEGPFVCFLRRKMHHGSTPCELLQNTLVLSLKTSPLPPHQSWRHPRPDRRVLSWDHWFFQAYGTSWPSDLSSWPDTKATLKMFVKDTCVFARLKLPKS